ncbi:MAG: nucleoside-triphosphatase [Desulfoplanes sp.]|nr:nucleoside-triphosphatase [Desulfoplanes sp.]
MNRRIIIVTGEPQEGKSTLLARCLAEVHNLHVGGFLAKGLWKNNLRDGFDLSDLAAGTSTVLARRNPLAQPGEIPFTFFKKGMEAGMRALESERCAHADLVCVDEVGKLEMNDRGWAPQLAPLLKLNHPMHLWVVRKHFVEPVCQKWNLISPSIVSVNKSDALATLLRIVRK